jgi:hypothetical protein
MARMPYLPSRESNRCALPADIDVDRDARADVARRLWL